MKQKTQKLGMTGEKHSAFVLLMTKGVSDMSEKTREMIQLVEILPETEQDFISEMIKRVVLAWNPYFTKVAPEERE